MSEPELPHAHAETPGKHILVVEDDRDLREAYQDILELIGFRVEGVGTGREAIQVLLRLSPSVMILDLNLPGSYSGTQVLAYVRSHPALCNTYVIVVSGKESAGASAPFMKPDQFLAKPVSAQKLVDNVILAYQRSVYSSGLGEQDEPASPFDENLLKGENEVVNRD
jgi:DNA-binding response OmpR family regulator